jgi:hypothetical protein
MPPKAKHFLPDGTLYKGPIHKMGNIVMTGKVHSPDSQILKHKK